MVVWGLVWIWIGFEALVLDLVDVGRRAKAVFLQLSGNFPLNHSKQKCEMFPDNNHVEGQRETRLEFVRQGTWGCA